MKRILVNGAVLALAIGGTGLSQAAPPSGYKVTGGGQIIAEAVNGPGDTIAFQVQNIDGAAGDEGDDAARGQVQSIERADGAGRPTDKFHGEANCLVVVGNTARFAGQTNDGGFFRVDLIDNGQGGAAESNDAVLVRRSAQPMDCDDDTNGDEAELSRGNVKIHAER